MSGMGTVVKVVAILGAALLSSMAGAQTRYNYKYSESLDAGAKIEALGSDLFGDSISYADGGIEFSIVDVAVKSNSTLPVQFGRRMSPGRSAAFTPGLGRRDYSKEILGRYWSPDIPVISGIYPTNSAFASGSARCTRATLAPDPIPIYPYNNPPLFPFNFWHGTTATIPGHGREELLTKFADAVVPSDGKIYLYTSRSNWRVSCLSSVKNGSGEGFELLLPDGTRYQFDWVARIKELSLIIPDGSALERFAVDREEVMLFASKAIDSFGNYVDYTYDPSNPQRLTKISSSDGAVIDIGYDQDGHISTVTSAGRTWTYSYIPHPNYSDSALLSQVTLPDASSWTYEYTNLMYGTNPEEAYWGEQCQFSAGSMTSSGGSGTTGQFRAKHPSGAIGTFTFKVIIQGLNNVPFGGCYFDASGQGTVQSGRPHAQPLNSVISKRIEGPGFAPVTWQITYAPTWSWESQCSSGCPTTATTVVTRSDGVREEYIFGSDFKANANQLLTYKVIEGGVTARTVSNSYAATPSAGTYPLYIGRFGKNGSAGDEVPYSLENPITRRNHPLTSIAVSQDGVIFKTDYSNFDVFARPANVTKSSASSP